MDIELPFDFKEFLNLLNVNSVNEPNSKETFF